MTLGVKQFAWCIFSNKIAHISNYSKQLFFSVPFYRVFLHKNQVITYSGVDGDVFKRVSMDTKRKLRKKVGIGENDVVLLLVGRIEARKNYEDGFFILKELEKLLPQKNIVLYVVLSHGYFNDFEYLRYCFKQMERLGVGSRVRIVSGISMQEVKLFYAVADSFLMLSKKLETFGMVALEALSSGLPVFGFRACATGEVVTYEPDRYLFKISDIDGVASAIAQYTRLPVEKKRFIEQQLRESTRQYSWEAFAKRLLANFNIER
jgi:glycosyltransferase involved in cell wall biosynthesis